MGNKDFLILKNFIPCELEIYSKTSLLVKKTSKFLFLRKLLRIFHTLKSKQKQDWSNKLNKFVGFISVTYFYKDLKTIINTWLFSCTR